MFRRLYPLVGNTIYYLSKPLQWLLWASRSRCYVVIEHGGKFLVVLNWLGKGEWSLPGGGVHKNEDPKSGAVREVYEETSIRLPEESLSERVSGFTKYFIGGKNYHVFTASLANEPTLHRRAGEILDVCWVTPEELAKMRVSEEIRAARLV